MKKIRTHCTYCGLLLETNGDCVSCPQGIRKAQGARTPADKVDRTCPWNDHGQTCGNTGSMADSTNGDGPLYCATHYWRLKGWPATARAAFYDLIGYREREHPGAPPPSLEDAGPLRSVAAGSSELLDRMTTGQIGSRARQPGEDEAFTIPL